MHDNDKQKLVVMSNQLNNIGKQLGEISSQIASMIAQDDYAKKKAYH